MRTLTADQQRVKSIVEAFNAPIVFYPGGWEDTVPEWLKLRVIAERVAMVCNGGWDKATDAEVTCYLYTASLALPLGSAWSEITLYQAAKQIPQLLEALPATPKELSDYQKHELDNLKRDIRNSQLKRQKTSKKEVTMPKRKLVIDEKDGSVMMGVMKEHADPHIQTVTGTLEEALGSIPKLLQDAEAKWGVSPKNPKYVAPPEPKKEQAASKPKTKTAADKSAATKPTEDLPLLADMTKPEVPVAPVAVEPIAGATEEEKAEDLATMAEDLATMKEDIKTQEIQPEQKGDQPAAALAPAAPVLAPVSQTSPTAPPATSAVPLPATGQFEYILEDGRGPFDTVQLAMDKLGLDKATRPAHNRWDRLSTELKRKIQRREKKS